MPILTLDATTPFVSIPLNPKLGEYTVASTEGWTGSVVFGYTINGLPRDYTDGEYTAGFDFVFHPAADFTTITFTGTGAVTIQITPSKWAK
jgi:hypothetical protein